MTDEPAQKRQRRTIESLRLNVEEARNGRTWLLLPEGFRDQTCGSTYPLPSVLKDLQSLTTIYIPPRKTDAGCVYIRRAIREFQEKGRRKQSALHDVSRRTEQIKWAQGNYKRDIEKARREMHEAVSEVRQQAEQAIANLNDLFALGRKGIEGQMNAHLEGREWKDERITARAFRECFRMVSQAVKGLGLPSDQKEHAEKAVVEELAASLEATKDALSHAPGNETEQ